MTRRLHWIVRHGLVVLLTAGIVLGTGCDNNKQDQDKDEIGSLYNLDPPELGVHATPGFESGVPVLCYHYFRARFNAGYLAKVFGSVLFGMPALGPREFWTTPASEFEKHLKYFRDAGIRVMTLDEVADLVAAHRALPENAVILTIDDADQSVYTQAWPLLRKYDMKAHLFVPSSHVASRWSELNVCTWEQLQEMSDSGNIIIGSHTRGMHFKVKTPRGLEPVFWNPEQMATETRSRNLSDLMRYRRSLPELPFTAATEAALTGPSSAVVVDLLDSRYDIASAVHRAPEWLAWPYGFAVGNLDSLARISGYRGTVSLAPAAFTASDTLMNPGRYTVTAKTTLAMIREIRPVR